MKLEPAFCWWTWNKSRGSVRSVRYDIDARRRLFRYVREAGWRMVVIPRWNW